MDILVEELLMLESIAVVDDDAKGLNQLLKGTNDADIDEAELLQLENCMEMEET